MRIRAIRGKNLASLAGEFAVDFGAEPLASAGVFAISGPTGAGKSTLLDTMCLALYHETPRLKAAQELNVAIPDVHDSSITPRDPRNLLRRGCGEGWAEVEFVDRSGVVWRARWSVARARGRATGRLQPASAELVRCEDQQRFDGKLAEIQARLVELTGLSFEQFCRSVLLAQNEFAALLKARQNERADLLEALTGSEIFQRISTLAHERHTQEQRQLQALEQQLQLTAALDDAQRQALQQRITDAEAGSLANLAQMRDLLAEQRWHLDGERLAERLCATEAQQAGLRVQLDASAAQQRQLRAWTLVEPLRPLVDAQHHLGGLIEALQRQLPALAAMATDAAGGVELARTELTRATLATEQAQASRDAARPQIAAARAADEAVRQTTAMIAAAGRELELAQAQWLHLQTQIDACAQRGAELTGCLKAWDDWQTGNPALSGDDGDWITLGTRLQTGAGLEQRLIAARQRRASQRADLDSAAAALVVCEQQHTRAAAVVGQAHKAFMQADAELVTLDPAAVDARRARLEDRQLALQRLQAAMQSWLDGNRRQQRLAQALCDAQTSLAPLQQQLSSAQDARREAMQQAAAAGQAFERASLLAHAHTERLRDLLVDGAPCPVCGATEHPRASAADGDTRTLLGLLGDDVLATRKALDEAIASVARAQGELAARQRECAQSAANANEAAGELQSLHEGLSRAATGLLAQRDDAERIEAALPALALALGDELAESARDRAAVVAAREAAQSARVQFDRSAQLAEQARLAMQDAQRTLAPRRTAVDAALGEIEALHGELAYVQEQLRGWPALALAGDAALTALWSTWSGGEALRVPAAQAKQELRQIDSERQGWLESQAQAAATRDRLVQALQVAGEALEQLRDQRQSLLADADVDRYAERLDAAVSTSLQLREQRQHAVHAALLASERAQSDELRCAGQLAESTRQQQTLQSQLLDRLKEMAPKLELQQPTLADLQTLLEDCPADLAQRLAAAEQLQRSWLDLCAQVDAIRSEIERWRRQAGSQRTPEEIGAALALAEAAHSQAQREMGALGADLRADDQRRLHDIEQRALLADRRAAAQRWSVLDELIGARDGAKFKRYAQQFTLEVLIEYANEHLSQLARRYRLRRGNEALSLLVIDGDLADEVRSVHSLSGGETFLVSLALALGLASLSAQRLRVESLFIDEGFGSLDADTLNTVMEALDRLQAQGRRIGVISHVHDMAERIGVQVCVEPLGAGRSRVLVIGQG